MNAIHVSVIVPHYQDLQGLGHCLTALGQQEIDPATVEVIVADNASPAGADAVRDVIAGRARLVIVEEKGAGPARNGGAAVAQGAILAFTDSDCLPSPGWLAAGIAALGHADFVGGAMRVSVGDAEDMTGAEAFETVFAFDNETYVRRQGFTVTANLFVRREDFVRVGGFRAGIPEDFEWCRRATAVGLSIGYAPEALVSHPARRTWPELLHKWRRLTREEYLYAVERGKGRVHWLLKTLMLPASIMPHAARALMSPSLPSPRLKMRAITTLARLRTWRTAERLRLMGMDQG